MADWNVFQSSEELRRLDIQNRLLRPCEQAVYRHILSERSGLRVLDVGCNNGSKTADRFSDAAIASVIGLERSEALVSQARRCYGDDKFAFYSCDAEDHGFSARLGAVMDERGVGAFDVINLSLVLSHLRQPGALLTALKRFLAPDGRLVIIEADDRLGRLSPDPQDLFGTFMELLATDPFSGDRNCCGMLPQILERCGYRQVREEIVPFAADGAEVERKADIFETFFSYLPEDVRLLLDREPENAAVRKAAMWLEEHYEALKRLILRKDTHISMGFRIFVYEIP